MQVATRALRGSDPLAWETAAGRELALGAAAGLATQALFWDATLGAGFFLWVVAAALGMIFVLRRGRAGVAAWLLAACAASAAGAVAARASDWALVLGVPGACALLVCLGAALRGELHWARADALPAALAGTVVSAPEAVSRVASLPGRAMSPPVRTVAKRLALGAVVGVPVAGLFAALLASDPGFAHVVERTFARVDTAAGFGAASLASGAAWLLAHALFRRRDEAPMETPELAPYRARDPEARFGAPADAPQAVLSPLAWGVVVAMVVAVFAAFAAGNARVLFGGHELVRAPGAPTYAAYLHAGFAQLLVAATLAVGMVVAGHAALVPAEVRERGIGTSLLAGLELLLLGLTAVALASCWQRVEIYEDAYGATHLRLGVKLVVVVVGAVLAAAALLAARRRFRTWAAAVVTLGALGMAAAPWLDADAYVARTNLDRFAAGRPLDEAYLATLGPDACAVLGHGAFAGDPGLRSRLADAWHRERPRDLRSARGIRSCGGSP
jgi:hypothetical protein